ncbi:putative F-box/LRR-repeat protein 23 [Arachis stenosperma]|uniref:putative F-box/LRR-repeat protein 23 n=1 Tax=Arachis stenosperma TaxID=217475 RepID=UPI0025AC6B70|nr:putative F-box/LRR-repeat protein 23 [Arachis stenosperma]
MALTSVSVAGEVSEAKVEETTIAAVFPNWLDLPTAVTANILQKVGHVDVLKSVQFVCTGWHCISMDPLFWRTIRVTAPKTYLDLVVGKHGFYAIKAINRSCSQLEDISIAYPTASILRHISNSGKNLRRMRLERCSPNSFCFYFGLSNRELLEAAKKLPLLEELEFLHPDVSMGCLETIGQRCPLLKVLKIIKRKKNIRGIECDDEEAFHIAKSMPNLRHLTHLRNRLTNAGLLAILNRCSHLDFLDVGGCFNLDLEDTSLGKSCAAQIKELRLPHEYLAESSDNEFDITTTDLRNPAVPFMEEESSDFWEEELLSSIGEEFQGPDEYVS